MLLLLQQTSVAPPPPPPIPLVVDQATAQQALLNAAAPAEQYQAARSQRTELNQQLQRLENRRDDLVRELSQESTPAAAKVGIEARLKEIDVRIAATDQQVATADQNVAQAAALPGATVEPPRPPRDGPSDAYVAVPVVLTIFVLFPMALAYSRRLWKRAATVVAPVPQEVINRLEQLGQSVESIALEVERIGEGQRFVTKVMTDAGRNIGPGAARPIPVPQAHAEHAGVRSEA